MSTLDQLSKAASAVFPGSRVYLNPHGGVTIVQTSPEGHVLNTASSTINLAMRERAGALADATANCVQIMARTVFFSAKVTE